MIKFISHFLLLFTFLSISCQQNTTDKQSESKTDSIISEIPAQKDTINSTPTEDKSVKQDDENIPVFYKNHNMDSLALNFNTKPTDNYIDSIKNDWEDIKSKELIINDGEGILTVFYNINNKIILLRCEEGLGDANEKNEYWFKNNSLIYRSLTVDVDDIGSEEEYVDNSDMDEFDTYYFIDNNLVMWLDLSKGNTKIKPYDAKEFSNENKYALSQIKQLKEYLKNDPELMSLLP